MSGSTLAGWPVYAEDEIRAVRDVLASGKVNYWTGELCTQFEARYAEHCRTDHAIALANGSVALELALEAAGIGAGDEVVVTPRSFVASASCVLRVGAMPVFADVDPESQNITADSVARVVTNATKAVVAVHHAGWPCEMDDLMQLAEAQGLIVVEDCAQAHGATYKGRPVGGIGHVGTFSFCQDKIITTGGEGGMLVTSDESIWQRAWSIKDHGKNHDAVFRSDRTPGFQWVHDSIGTNWRMTEMQAAIGLRQLDKLADWHARRAANAARIAQTLGKYPAVRVPMPADGLEHAWYRLYAVLDPDRLREGYSRQRLLEEFSSRKIPVYSGGCPEIYREQAYLERGIGPAEPLPVAASLGPVSLAFAVHPTLSEANMKSYCAAIDDVMSAATAD